MSQSILLPRLVGTGDAAVQLVYLYELDNDLTKQKIRILGRNLSTATKVFADTLVEILVERKAGEIVLIGCPRDFTGNMFAAAKKAGYRSIRVGDSDDLEKEDRVMSQRVSQVHAQLDEAKEYVGDRWGETGLAALDYIKTLLK